MRERRRARPAKLPPEPLAGERAHGSRWSCFTWAGIPLVPFDNVVDSTDVIMVNEDQKEMGRKMGEPLERIVDVEVVDVSREPLIQMLNEPNATALEGFPVAFFPARCLGGGR